MKRAFVAILRRDLQIAFRRVSELANPLLFFIIVASLFPLAVFVLGTIMAFIAPEVAQFTWCLAFGAPLAGWLAARRAG